MKLKGDVGCTVDVCTLLEFFQGMINEWILLVLACESLNQVYFVLFSCLIFVCFCFRLSSFDDCEIWFIFYVVSLTTKVIVISWYKTIHNIKDKIIFLCASCCFFNHKKAFKKLLKSGVGILIFHSLCRNLVDYLYAQLSRYVLTNGLGVEYWIY